MTIQEKAKHVHKSYIRAGGRSFVTAFYAKLMDTHHDIRKYFEGADMEAQTDNLARAIIMSFMFVDQDQHAATQCLNKVRESHDRHHLNIAPELYDVWLRCLIETVSFCDPDADSALLEDWHSVMTISIEHVRQGY
ncbi:MAG: globin domain-containing protein [Mariprofundaceae bacterium]